LSLRSGFPELWREIFYYATFQPGLLDTSPLPPTSDELRSWTVPSQHQAELSWRLQTQISIVSVCKLWWNVGVEFLYRHIRIRNTLRLTLLTNTLENNAKSIVQADANHSIRPLALCVKRIDLELAYWWTSSPVQVKALNSLLRMCGSVQILQSYGFVHPLHPALVPAIPEQARNLRHWRIQWDFLPTDPASVGRNLLQHLHHFGILEVLQLEISGGLAFPYLVISLPKLHMIGLNVFALSGDETNLLLTSISRWDLPAFQSFQLTTSWDERGSVDGLRMFFDSHGPKITTFGLIGSPDPLPATEPTLETFLNCPSLEDLSANFGALSKPLPQLFHLRRIRISGNITHLNHITLNAAMRRIFSMPNRQFTCIRFMTFDYPYFFRSNHCAEYLNEWKGWLEQGAAEGIRLEDVYGSRIEKIDEEPL
jgi:hypothetical protein